MPAVMGTGLLSSVATHKLLPDDYKPSYTLPI
jgi:hypothetical protein